MKVTVTLSESEAKAAQEYVKGTGLTLSEAMKIAFMDAVQDKYDKELEERSYTAYERPLERVSK